MCTLTKDIHFLCPSKPFVCDNTEGICGLESIKPDTSCPAEATPRSQVEVTQAKIIGNRWLVNTPARTATLTYDQYDTATRIILPNQTLWITVPKGSILHIDKLALYHLTDDEYQAEIEISPFFKQHSFVLDPELEERIKEEGTQLIDLTPVNTALEAIARLPPAGAPIIRSLSPASRAQLPLTMTGPGPYCRDDNSCLNRLHPSRGKLGLPTESQRCHCMVHLRLLIWFVRPSNWQKGWGQGNVVSLQI
ncbi:hypothetical protein G5714_006187 [Onychostoma macrolepis]|uniref:Uncharacterized protein n=1 Tax=Onychostoma macrolepis TaxID=369639 RepID=A0A7J6D386_9TELE|nr:hypothetical protein G5714_006187 [Onychostoma macrolepis]